MALLTILRLRSAFFAFRATAEILRLLSNRDLSYAMYARKSQNSLLTHKYDRASFVASVSADSTLTLSSAVKWALVSQQNVDEQIIFLEMMGNCRGLKLSDPLGKCLDEEKSSYFWGNLNTNLVQKLFLFKFL